MQDDEYYMGALFDMDLCVTMLVALDHDRWYIKLCLAHRWNQFFDIVLKKDLKIFKTMFRVQLRYFIIYVNPL